MITQQVFAELDLVVHTVTGELDETEFLKAGQALYDLDPIPSHSIWDLSHASLSQLTLDRLRAMQSTAVPLVRGREGGRTAVVAPADLAFGLSRQYVTLIDSLQLPFEHEVFRTVEDALAWLGIEPDFLNGSATPEATP